MLRDFRTYIKTKKATTCEADVPKLDEDLGQGARVLGQPVYIK